MRAVSLAGKTLLNRYRVVRALGRGALATVYLAFDRFGTPYALKVFPPGPRPGGTGSFGWGSSWPTPT